MSDPSEYERLKAFVAYFDEHLLDTLVPGVPAKSRPMAVLETFEMTMTRAQVAQGLRQGVNDIAELSLTWPRERIAEIDEDLRRRGVITLSELQLRHSRRLAAVMRAGVIRTETDYYLLKGVSDGGADILPAPELARVRALIDAYEEKA